VTYSTKRFEQISAAYRFTLVVSRFFFETRIVITYFMEGPVV